MTNNKSDSKNNNLDEPEYLELPRVICKIGLLKADEPVKLVNNVQFYYSMAQKTIEK